MREGWFKDIEKDCPICERTNKPFEGQILPSGDMLLKYRCVQCNHVYTRRDKGPEATVEFMVDFRRRPDMWVKPKGRSP